MFIKPPVDETRVKMTPHLNIYYRIFFLYIEPISALAGAVAAANPSMYLTLLDSNTSQVISMLGKTAAVGTVINQLANLYLFFCLTEALVLRAAGNHLPVWCAIIFAMLIADFGHLASGWRLGYEKFWHVSELGLLFGAALA